MPVNWCKRAFRDQLMPAALAACGVGLLFYSRPVSAAVVQAFSLCVRVLLPSLFPFFVLSSLLVSLGVAQRLSPLLERPMRWLFGLPGSCAAAVLLGAVGGYPLGARTAVTLYQQRQCSKEDALRVLCFCNNAGPAFIISAVGGGLLGDAGTGVLLYGLHLLSALLMGILFAGSKRSVKQSSFSPKTLDSTAVIPCFLQAVTGSLGTFLNVCAFVLFFAVLTCLLRQLSFLAGLGPLAQGLLYGSLELTSGAAQLSGAGLPRGLLLPALSFLCGWGGLSVQFQTISLLYEADLPAGGYLKAKLLHGVLAAGSAFLLCR